MLKIKTHNTHIVPKRYSRIALYFFVITCLLSLSVFYYVFGKAEVTIISAFQKVSADTEVQIKENSQEGQGGVNETLIQGKMFAYEVESTVTSATLGKKIVFDDTIGSVKLINNFSKDQILVATTRLLAADGTLFRIKDRVLIPAGGAISARIYPDKPEIFSELQPTKFTIPGLGKDLQEIIYAELDHMLKPGENSVPIVSEQDLNLIDKKLLEAIDDSSLNLLKEKLTDEEALYSKLMQKEIIEKKIVGVIGEERDSIEASAKAKIMAIVFDEIHIINVMKKKLSSTLSSGKELKDIDPKSIIYTVEKIDREEGVAYVKVYAEGKAQVRSESDIFNKSKIRGQSEENAKKYFKDFKEVENVEIQFFPSWFRRIPRLDERIEIRIK